LPISAETARLTATLSMAVRSATVLALRPRSWPSTAITRHSVMDRLKRAEYSRAMSWLTRFDSTDRR